MKAAGGEHCDIMGDYGSPNFCTLARVDDPPERAWAAELLESLVALQGIAVTPAHRRSIYHALKLLAESESRTMTDLLHGPLQEPALRAALDRYNLDGPLGTLIDSQRDTFGEKICSRFSNSSTLWKPAKTPHAGETSAKTNTNMFQAPTGEKTGREVVTNDRATLDQNQIAGQSTFQQGNWGSASREKVLSESRNESAGLGAQNGTNGTNGRAALDQNSVAGDSNFQQGSWSSQSDTDAVPLMQSVNGQMMPMPGLSAGGSGTTIPSGNQLPEFRKMEELAKTPDGMRQLEAGIQKSKWGDLKPEQRLVIENNPELRAFAASEAQNRMNGSNRDMDSDNYMMLQGLAMAMPRDNAQPTATQIRIGNPDR